MRETRIKESLDESKKMERKLRSRSFASSSRSTPFQSTYTRPSILGKYERVIKLFLSNKILKGINTFRPQ